jgi:drug/metabolite transporter (DMT)-like permease
MRAFRFWQGPAVTPSDTSTAPQITRAWLQIHFCVVLWGFTAILGRLISLEALPLVLWRMVLVSAALFLLPAVWRSLRVMPARLVAAYCGIGVLVALHWVTFYGSIKLANASVAATCIATVPIFLAVVEPALTGRRFRWQELLLGLLVLPGIALLVGGTPAEMNAGIIVGIVSAFFVSLFAALNKRLVLRTDSLTMTALEMGSGAAFVALLGLLMLLMQTGPVSGFSAAGSAGAFELPSGMDLVYLLILAFGCTLLPFALSLVALRHLSAYATSLAVNLEPLYAIVLAIILLGEQQQLHWQFYAGAILILAVVLAYPLLQRRRLRI